MLISNLAAFTEALGIENAPTIFSLSTIAWDSESDRDEFIKVLTGKGPANG